MAVTYAAEAGAQTDEKFKKMARTGLSFPLENECVSATLGLTNINHFRYYSTYVWLYTVNGTLTNTYTANNAVSQSINIICCTL